MNYTTGNAASLTDSEPKLKGPILQLIIVQQYKIYDLQLFTTHRAQTVYDKCKNLKIIQAE